MEELLLFIIKYCKDLYRKYGFKFKDSLWSPSFGGDAYIILENEFLILRFVSDRAELFLEFQPKAKGFKKNWFSLAFVRKSLMKHELELYSKLDSNNGVFITTYLKDILDLFSESQLSETVKNLKLLEKERSERVFGKKKK
ncbi:hypothetical protein [Leptospira kmetyi]|uniref:hypothetical protein n=1 Tax=Leptospira kmetyi TaxID=408139 RepID=UPI001083721A|nr:hypothetical protein [Leptospira kmetyi]TGK20283.1 hypothetical protein EHO62_05515 [Leptospira kmetyi]TGK34828.1 hypothetical protein EHO66_00055 [Leptospira kmetyi]